MTVKDLDQLDELFKKHFEPISVELKNIDSALKKIIAGDYPAGYIRMNKNFMLKGSDLLPPKEDGHR